MPNHVKNILKMKDITTLPIFTNEEGRDMEMFPSFDFEKIIPMPKSLDIESSSIIAVAVEAAIRRASLANHEHFGPRVIPAMSDSDYKAWLYRSRKTEDELLELGATYLHNMIFHGAATWYDWLIKHWGTKWNSYENVQIDSNNIMFETAWSAPEPVIAQLAEMYPKTEIEHWWADEDIGRNTGYAKYSEGKAVMTYHYEDYSSEACATYIRCWGESKCLYKDENGMWHHQDCDTCHGCD